MLNFILYTCFCSSPLFLKKYPEFFLYLSGILNNAEIKKTLILLNFKVRFKKYSCFYYINNILYFNQLRKGMTFGSVIYLLTARFSFDSCWDQKNLLLIRLLSPRKTVVNQLVVSLPSNTSPLSSSEPSLNCGSYICYPVTESISHTHKHITGTSING